MFQTIKDKGLIALRGNPHIIIGDYKREEKLLVLKSLVPDFEDKVVLLIHDIAQLYDFVGKIPEIAWDLVDFAEEPLDVIYPAGKNVSPALLRSDGRIRVRLMKDGAVFQALKQFKKAFFCIPVSNSEEIEKIPLNEFDNKDFKLATKVLQLEVNGEIRFLSK